MTKIWRVIIVALLAAGVVMAFNLKGDDKAKAPADTAVVQQAASPPAADKPEPAKPEGRDSNTSAEPSKDDPEKASVKTDEPEKKPEAAKPVKATAPAKPKGLPKIIDVGGDNCIPCKLMIPVLDGLKSDYKGKLDVVVISKDKDPDALKRYRTSTIPTQILYDANGKELERHFGFWSKDDILDAFKQHGIKL